MLSPLKEQVARIVASLAEADDFTLAGGAALIVRGDVDRETRDPDFFGLSAVAVDRLVHVLEFADLVAVVDRYGFDRLLKLAAEKDPGFEPGVFAVMAYRFAR